MDTNRRAFLIQGGATFGVIGLGYLLWDSAGSPEVPGDAKRPPVSKPPTGLLAEALARMKAENKPGVAIRIPVEPKMRHVPGHCIVESLNRPDANAIRLYAQSVFVCLESAVLQEQIRGADPADSAVLFDSTLRAVAGIPFNYGTDWDRFVPVLLELVQGKGDERLRSRAESIRRSAPAPVMDAVDRLDSAGDRATVAAHAAKIAPLLVYEDLQPTNEIRKKALSQILRGYFDSTSATVPGPKLPYGVKASPGGGCGDGCEERSEAQREMVVECGMAMMGPGARSFARYLTS
jgi:hypothetical protein